MRLTQIVPVEELGTFGAGAPLLEVGWAYGDGCLHFKKLLVHSVTFSEVL